MRRWIWILSVAVVLVGLLGVGSALAITTVAPFPVNSPLFTLVQRPVEQLFLNLTPNQAGKASRALQIARHRLDDLSQLVGSGAEAQATRLLEESLRQAVLETSAAPQIEAARLHPQLSQLLQAVERLLPVLSALPQQDPQGWASFLTWESAVSREVGLPSLVLADLGAPAGLTAEPGALPAIQPTTAPTPTSTPVIVSQRIVRFQDGSPGAQHLFFPLDGAHIKLDCIACHAKGEYAGTPTACASCHQAPDNHYPGLCTLCHTTTAWKPASFDHSRPEAASCESCHARPAGHYPGACSACHSTSAWIPAHFDHATAQATDCVSCHARPAGHYNGQCSGCHSTNAWLPAHFDHAVAGATDCQSCHERPANHYNGQCSACHNTNAWKPASFNHQVAGATDCQSCHARPSGHYSGQCSACHNTSAWKPASFNHAAAGATDCQSCHARPANHFPGQCSDCHNTNTWAGATFNHTFPTSHGGANGECAKCHPNGTGSWTCYTCHDQASMDSRHQSVSNYSSNCIACHPTGGGGGD